MHASAWRCIARDVQGLIAITNSFLGIVQVPSAGILTNGTSYLFYKCSYDGQPELVCSGLMKVALHMGISSPTALDAVNTVLRTMLQLFIEQKTAVQAFNAKEAAQSGISTHFQNHHDKLN